MKDAAEAIDRLFSHMGTVLRYVAPGFAALFVVTAVFPESRAFLLSRSPAVLVLGILLGPAIYAIHTLAVLRLVWLCAAKKWIERSARKRQGFKITPIDEQDWQRWLRRANKEERVVAIQKELNNWSAMLHFIYCLGYAMISIPIAGCILNLFKVWSISSYSHIIVIFIAGLLVLSVAFYSEVRLVKKEHKVIEEYPQ